MVDVNTPYRVSVPAVENSSKTENGGSERVEVFGNSAMYTWTDIRRNKRGLSKGGVS